MGKTLVLGNRVPKEFFVTSGYGESGLTVHAGSYHSALYSAGIEMCNIMTYSSVLPAIAEVIEKPVKLVHGCVMESIMAVHTGGVGERVSAGVAYGWLLDKVTGEKMGGVVCENAGNFVESDLYDILVKSLHSVHSEGFSGYDLVGLNVGIRSEVCKSTYGTALVALCFTSYEWEEL